MNNDKSTIAKRKSTGKPKLFETLNTYIEKRAPLSNVFFLVLSQKYCIIDSPGY